MAFLDRILGNLELPNAVVSTYAFFYRLHRQGNPIQEESVTRGPGLIQGLVEIENDVVIVTVPRFKGGPLDNRAYAILDGSGKVATCTGHRGRGMYLQGALS